LKHHPKFCPHPKKLLCRETGYVFTLDEYLPTIRLQEPYHVLHQDAFARTAYTDNDGDLAALRHQVDPLEDRVFAKRFIDFSYLYHRINRHTGDNPFALSILEISLADSTHLGNDLSTAALFSFSLPLAAVDKLESKD
jgi:hypothetical protein